MKTRPAASGMTLEEAMERQREFHDKASLMEYLKQCWGPAITEDSVTIVEYNTGVDERTGWHTHLLCVDGKATLFTDGPLEGSIAVTEPPQPRTGILKVTIQNGDPRTAKITVDGKPLFCESVDLHIRYDGVKATIVVFDVDLQFEGPAEVKTVPKGSPIRSIETVR